MSSFELEKKFFKALDYLYEQNFQLASHACRLGYPVLTNRLPTAGVQYNKEKNAIEYMFNPEFAESLTVEELAFVWAHEGMHVINFHAQLFYDEYTRLKNMSVSDKNIGTQMRKLNVAADCVVNDSLTNLYDLEPQLTKEKDIDPKTGKEVFKPKAIYGMETVGTHTHKMTVQEVLMMLKDDQQNQAGEGEGSMDIHNWDSFFDGNGSFSKEFIDKIKEFVENGMDNSSLNDQEKQLIEKLSNSTVFKKAGTIPLGKMREIDNRNKSLKWDMILSRFVSTKKYEDIWSRTNRKMYDQYPDVLLPAEMNTDEQEVFVAIDASGSIDYEALSMFASLLKNAPRHLKITAISFDTHCYEYSLFGEDRPKGGGGTAFNIIEEYIQNNLDRYPKIVLVLTDGCGTAVKPERPGRWAWVLYGSHQSNEFCKDMFNIDIKEVLK